MSRTVTFRERNSNVPKSIVLNESGAPALTPGTSGMPSLTTMMVRRKPPFQVRFDLRDGLPREIVDRAKRLRLIAVLAADRCDEEVSGFRQPTQLVDMAVEVIRQERHGVLVPGMAERTARVNADEEGAAR